MRVVQVIHGYPPDYEAGSEVYTRTVARGLADRGHEVHVFARIEDPFAPDFAGSTRQDGPVTVHLVNHARDSQRFRSAEIENVFGELLARLNPDVVHIGHLSHLSIGLPQVARERDVPVAMTLHDYWMACPRGQFLQWGLNGTEAWPSCDGQEDSKCARMCYNRMSSGLDSRVAADETYWTSWIKARMEASHDAIAATAAFLSPSRHLAKRFMQAFPEADGRIKYAPYGFEVQALRRRGRRAEADLVLGFIGRHHPSKGLDLLIRAHAAMQDPPRLRIWGAPSGNVTSFAKQLAAHSPHSHLIEWPGAYRNDDIAAAVFDRCDAIVVPSIWDENSPLVVQEACAAGVPVITSDHGGMRELMDGGVPGWIFPHRSAPGLTRVLEVAARQLRRGQGPKANPGAVTTLGEHLNVLEETYAQLMSP